MQVKRKDGSSTTLQIPEKLTGSHDYFCYVALVTVTLKKVILVKGFVTVGQANTYYDFLCGSNFENAVCAMILNRNGKVLYSDVIA